MAYIRKYKTTSGATGVQVCYKEGNQVVKTVHVGSANSEVALAKLLKKARGIIDADKGTPMFDLDKYNKKWLFEKFTIKGKLVDEISNNLNVVTNFGQFDLLINRFAGLGRLEGIFAVI